MAVGAKHRSACATAFAVTEYRTLLIVSLAGVWAGIIAGDANTATETSLAVAVKTLEIVHQRPASNSMLSHPYYVRVAQVNGKCRKIN